MGKATRTTTKVSLSDDTILALSLNQVMKTEKTKAHGVRNTAILHFNKH